MNDIDAIFYSYYFYQFSLQFTKIAVFAKYVWKEDDRTYEKLNTKGNKKKI